MKRTITLLLSIFMLFLFFTNEATAYAREVLSENTESFIGFTGKYEPIGKPDPAPEINIKSNKNEAKATLPNTGEVANRYLFFTGSGFILFTIIIWIITQKRKKDIYYEIS
ncbi:LPXTG cell wall anchor domain-containing protein [Enterococcus casseliflavus]|uniref:LPXTG cell wall anchor domain-containing protein n=1 Tax=Enterococcus casseliflavus TaxID=37734 RepID=UPI0025427B4D|nr:LPXTG cell wall anchor domain-containing protein [Enterococcus casseliflavus]MDK4450921.1 LPXTG cell wall anchor domain-containing protein [Enterococcus casseliflavus]